VTDVFFAFAGDEEPQSFLMLPPGSSAMVDLKNNIPYLEVPLWLYWLALSHAHAAKAHAARRPDAVIDEIFEVMKGNGAKSGKPGKPGVGAFFEMTASMVVISAAANAIDGFYGAVKPFINPPGSGAKRHRQIIETLKLGFSVGRHQSRWLKDLDWLFGVRDAIVHHAQARRPMVVTRTTANNTVVGDSPEAFHLSAINAERADSVAGSVILACLDHPKQITREWAEAHRKILPQVFGEDAKNVP
jgi:hypothetical protein